MRIKNVDLFWQFYSEDTLYYSSPTIYQLIWWRKLAARKLEQLSCERCRHCVCVNKAKHLLCLTIQVILCCVKMYNKQSNITITSTMVHDVGQVQTKWLDTSQHVRMGPKKKERESYRRDNIVCSHGGCIGCSTQLI